jgi:heptosyltransferase-2
MYASGACERVGYHDYPHNQTGYKLTDVNRLITRGPVRGFPEHEIERQLDILRFLGADPGQFDLKLEVWTTAEDERFARDLFDRHGLSAAGLLVAFAPGAAWPFRRWPVERFVELGRWLQAEYGAYILIFAAGNERELVSRVERGLRRGQTLGLAGKTAIRQMGSVLRRCRLFVGNDSGPLHVAVAAGVPVVGLFGPGEYERFRPWGPDQDVVRLAFPCSPCSQNCLFDEARCIKGISVREVKAAIARKLEPR